MIKDSKTIKETGATFTPEGLADYLSKRILSYSSTDDPVILDPACGDGILLSSIGRRFNEIKRSYHLIGVDQEEDYLNVAKGKLESDQISSFELRKNDFLDEIDLVTSQKSISFNEETQSRNNFADIIIANPPYVRTQVLGAEKAQILARKFNLTGRVDLYYPFLIAMTHALKERGIIGVITSNRYLFTKSGSSVRRFLIENYEILEVIDLGDTKMFEAAVLPAIFIGRKRKSVPNSAAKFLKIYEDHNGYEGKVTPINNVFDILDSDLEGYFSDGSKRYKKSIGTLKFTDTKENTWAMLTKKEASWIQKIEDAAYEVVGDSFKVRVGIKTTADKIFISDHWNELSEDTPEEELLKELISQQNINRWSSCDKKKLKVLYPHYSEDGIKGVIDLENFPKAKNYLLQHEKILRGRKYVIDSGRNWYEIWVPQDPSLWNFPKVVFPDISAYPRFFFDISGKIVNGNCYWIVAKHERDVEKLLLIQGVSNTNLMTKYHDLVFSNKLYSGRRRYFSQYVQNYPIPDARSKIGKEIIVTVRELNKAQDKNQISKLSIYLENQVAASFGVDPVLELD